MSDDEALDGAARPDLRVLSESATDEDIAAVSAVIEATLAELADDAADVTPGQSAWQRSQRSMRTPLRQGPGEWRAFPG